jgi:hypothetical protein
MVEGKKKNPDCSFIQHPQGPEITSLHPKSRKEKESEQVFIGAG